MWRFYNSLYTGLPSKKSYYICLNHIITLG